jgi:hypothetical protein
MTLHRGDPVLYQGERMIVKVVPGDGRVVVEDDAGFAIVAPVDKVQPVGYTATVDSDGWVRSLEEIEGA